MKARRFLLTFLAAASIALPLRAIAAPTLPQAVRTTNNVQVARGQVTPLIERLVGKLKAGEPNAAQEIVEEVLPPAATPIGGAPAAGGAAGTPSPQFLEAYAQVLNDNLMPLASDPNARVRLSAAIVAARVAERCNNAKLLPVILDFLDDQHEAVVHWAIKGTKGLVGPAHMAAAGVQGSRLMPAFLAAAKKYAASGPTIKAAYEALDEAKRPNTPAPAIKAAVDAMHELLETRRNLYIKGVPEFPSVDTLAINFLSLQNVWRAQAAPQQLRTVQLVSDMLWLVAQRYGKGNSTERGEMADMIRKTGGGLQVIGMWTDAAAKMDPIAKPVVQLTAIASPDKVLEVVKAVHPGLTGFAAWKDLKPPPTIE